MLARTLAGIVMMLPIFLPGQAVQERRAPSHDVPVVSAGAGPCWVEFTVTGANSKPVYDAKIRVHIDHGFLGIRQTDLEVGTNAHGKARFEGLPVKVGGTLFFRASKGQLRGFASFNPEKNCHAKHAIFLHLPRTVPKPPA